MLYRSLSCAALCAIAIHTAQAHVVDYSKYPDVKGQWERFVVRGGDGLLMPAKPDQPPPDTRYFTNRSK